MPKICVVVRKAYGAGLYAMAGPGFEPDATLALPTARIAVMGPEPAVNAVYFNKIQAIEDPDERARVRGRAAARVRGGHRPAPPGGGERRRRRRPARRPPRRARSAGCGRPRRRTARSATAATGCRRYDAVALVESTVDGRRRHRDAVDRPEALNAISGEMADELAGAFLQAAARPDAGWWSWRRPATGRSASGPT